MKAPFIIAAACLISLLAAPFVRLTEGHPTSINERRATSKKEMQAGNFKDAYEGFRALALGPVEQPATVGQDLQQAIQCLRNLGLVHEIDALRDEVIKVHAKNWRLLWAAAQSMISGQHSGYIISGKFHRGQHRGSGQIVQSFQRDRVRALQLMVQAMGIVEADIAAARENRSVASNFYQSVASMLKDAAGYRQAWRLQYLTDLTTLPDYEPGWGYPHAGTAGAPVDASGEPVYHQVPASWETAESDGERWRWALLQMVEHSPSWRNNVRYQFAQFLESQFGVQTMRQYGAFFGRGGGFSPGPASDGSGGNDTSGTYEVHTLSENETIARLATGIRRFTLPEEFNFIRIYRDLLANDTSGYGGGAVQQLAGIFENRRQYKKAADTWRTNIRKFGASSWKKDRLQQIVSNWGRFESTLTQPAGEGATVDFRFRNGHKVSFEAHQIDVKRLLSDVKRYLKSNPGRLDWQRLNISNIGYRLVQKNQRRYIGKRIARWELDLDPLEDHFDRRVTVSTPLQKAGAYLLTANMADGNTSKIVVWLSDTAIVKKPLDGKAYYFVADAVTGKPIPHATLELFGYRQEHLGKNRYRVHTRNYAEYTDSAGQVFQSAERDSNYQWIATATTREGRFAYLGFTSVWHARYHDSEYSQVKVFTITDRPVYRPEHDVQFKFWVRYAKYDHDDNSQFAGQTFRVEIHNPKGETIFNANLTADEYGGLEGKYTLPSDATLGVYQLIISGYGGASFRVEEYKKPEFEVTVKAPEKPVQLGEKITVTIEAKYYFGSPVTEARVKYKILRTEKTGSWYPDGDWDWLYGSGYWWFGYDCEWYPGWRDWGCRRPFPWWWWRSPTPPEVIAEREVEIGADGKVSVEIDTAFAKAIHPDQDHSYQIIAEVVDASRRTIVGQGRVLVARRPFKVFVWLDRGYTRVGERVQASLSARTLDQQPVQGAAKLTLYSITYDSSQKPVETPVQVWNLETDAQGRLRLPFRASRKGQYRLSCTVTDAASHAIEGGYLFTVIGDRFDGAEFRFNDLELITDKREYHPGDTVRMQVNTNQPGAAVLLFVRPANGVYLPPRVLRPRGKSTIVDIAVVKKDMPNFFVEAVTISRGKVHTLAREIHVPPEKRVLDVEVLPSATEYKPGEHAKVRLKLTDSTGEPFVGSIVVAIYDKAVEYISGGSNVADIKKFFWNWRRHHRAATETSLGRRFVNLVLPNTKAMGNLGAFGHSVADELKKGAKVARGDMRQRAQKSAAPRDSLALEDDGRLGLTRDSFGERNGKDSPTVEALVEPLVRTQFADTALWKASLDTDEHGIAEVELDMPENLTTWKTRVWGMGHGTRVGQGEAEIITRKNLIIRLQAPRFFVETDEVVLSANVHNYLASSKPVEVSLELEGGTLEGMDDLTRLVTVAADGETRVDWRVKAVAEGEAVVRMFARTNEESDAIQMTFPVHVHGMLKMDSFSGALRPDDTRGQFTIHVPEERRVGESRLEVRYSPTLAGAMVDALPYLADYPYGCTEQTLNRFLPTVITQKILLEMGLDLAAIRDKRTNLNAQEIGDDRERAKGWKRFGRNPVFDEEEVRRMVKTGVQRLTEMQLSDGGWGWFSGWREHSYPHTTAVVVHGLQVARQNDVALVPGVLERGIAWLKSHQDDRVRSLEEADKNPRKSDSANNLDALLYMVLVDADVTNDAMRDYLYRDRNGLAVYSKAMYGLALEKQGAQRQLGMILRNIEQYLLEDDENQTAWLNLPSGYWWYWYGSEFEAHAYYLKLLARTDPKGRVASRLVKYLINNRKNSTYWSSTRDTAICIEAIADYLRASDEDRPDMTVEVWIDGRKYKEERITADNLFTFDNKLVLTGDAVTSGDHVIELRKTGTGPLYYNGYLSNFTLESHITRAGLELRVDRKYYKLVPVEKKIQVPGSRGQAVQQRVEKFRRVEIENLATLKSGDLVEIELEIASKNDYEYIIFEDHKAAGFEPVDLRSGYTGNSMGAYVEFRDDRVSLFVRHLARGKHSVAYRVRAEIPGKFSALPTVAYAMYAPELKGNSEEIKLFIED